MEATETLRSTRQQYATGGRCDFLVRNAGCRGCPFCGQPGSRCGPRCGRGCGQDSRPRGRMARRAGRDLADAATEADARGEPVYFRAPGAVGGNGRGRRLPAEPALAILPIRFEVTAMSAANAAGEGSPPPAGDGTGHSTRSLMGDIAKAAAGVRETVSSMLDLAAVEARMAGAALSWIIVLSFVAVICVVAAWLGLLAAAAFWVTSLGFPAVGALLVIAALNAAVAALLVYASVRLAHRLTFPAVRRQLNPNLLAKDRPS